jgi:hypothetical protein
MAAVSSLNAQLAATNSPNKSATSQQRITKNIALLKINTKFVHWKCASICTRPKNFNHS